MHASIPTYEYKAISMCLRRTHHVFKLPPTAKLISPYEYDHSNSPSPTMLISLCEYDYSNSPPRDMILKTSHNYKHVGGLLNMERNGLYMHASSLPAIECKEHNNYKSMQYYYPYHSKQDIKHVPMLN